MAREFSAGGVLLRRMRGRWWVAAIQPAGKADKSGKPLLALPKGNVDRGELPENAALREVLEETGIHARLVDKLDDIRYAYARSWGDKERVHKLVSFYLLAYESGKLGEISKAMKREVSGAEWLPLEDAPMRLAYGSERDVVVLAQEYVRVNEVETNDAIEQNSH